MKPLHNLTVKDTSVFAKAVKNLKRKFRNIDKDWLAFVDGIKTEEDLGVYLGSGVYKARISNSDKRTGKSGGYRLISYLKLLNNELYLIYIYDKSDFETLSEKEIDQLILEALD
ncbi:type II toxin-antitoxin system RelE/ParE family toxin [Sulfurospirillum sp. T05]|uniref:Type II toxin-antitoxin system RelE/ParE family toxin n=1 Tax=Sulfurospirillum tamanense TaxID=2813362 RepID=A0ABS2WQ86_9BACT|nr:type II toxin-antitoxin system RelE/ParE family toxin [Sulfurospirillum tamanensis]